MENKNLTILLTVMFVTSLIFVAVIIVNNSEPEIQEKYPVIYIIDTEYFPGFGFDDRWCLHYAINGVAMQAFFESVEKVELFKKYLSEIGVIK